MPYMNWTDEHSIGIAMFDDEHKGLAEIINDLHEGVVRGIDEAELRKIAADLVEFTVIHFKHEEMYFADFEYPEAKMHVAQHAAIKEQVFAYYRRITGEHRPELAMELLDFVRDWLFNHIKTSDKKLGQYLRAHGYGHDASRFELHSAEVTHRSECAAGANRK